MSGKAAPPTAVSAWEIASASMMNAPSSANRLAALDLPEPMPPVSPATHGRCGGDEILSANMKVVVAQSERAQPLAEEQHDHAGQREVRTERECRVSTFALDQQGRNAQHGADDG